MSSLFTRCSSLFTETNHLNSIIKVSLRSRISKVLKVNTREKFYHARHTNLSPFMTSNDSISIALKTLEHEIFP